MTNVYKIESYLIVDCFLGLVIFEWVVYIECLNKKTQTNTTVQVIYKNLVRRNFIK